MAGPIVVLKKWLLRLYLSYRPPFAKVINLNTPIIFDLDNGNIWAGNERFSLAELTQRTMTLRNNGNIYK